MDTDLLSPPSPSLQAPQDAVHQEPDVLILATRPDASLTSRKLSEAGFSPRPLMGTDPLPDDLTARTGVLLIAEEMLTPARFAQLAGLIEAQPAWSDLPVILVASATSDHLPLSALTGLGNVSLLQRPMDPDALVSAVAAALRARQRQLEVRDLLLQQREQAARKDEFLAMLAHELRNPLAPIRYAAHILQTPELPVARHTQVAALIERQTQHMGRIIDQLLEVSRLTRGLIRLDRTRVNMAVLAREAVAAHAIPAEGKGIALHCDSPPSAWVDGDATRLRQVLDNLIDNAIKFSPTGQPVRLQLEAGPDEVRVRVIDRGDGFDPAMQAALFEPLMQVDRTLDRVKGGLGLGLALVKELVDMHGGRVHAFSEGQGQGSVFTVELPACKPAEASSSDDHMSSSEPASPREILIAEDNLDTADALQLILETQGYQVQVVHDGLAAVAALQSTRPHALICDIGLPGLNGYEVARSAGQGYRPALMIAVTGYGTPEDRTAALDAGFDVHLAKPIEVATLLAKLEG